jgi:glycine cleavage system T protein (aminomethyltransferase)
MALEDFDRVDDYGDAAAEAIACRNSCALFDFSFLECARLQGSGARGVIEAFTGRSLESLGVGRICYALRVDPAGRTVADLTVWRTAAETYEVMSGRREDVLDLLTRRSVDIDIADMTADISVLAIQGPSSLDALRGLGDTGAIKNLEYFSFSDSSLAGIACRTGRLGYTGETGFEIVVPRRHERNLWQALSARARPAGFIAVDILRIEAGFVLFCNEFRLPVSPREAGLGRFHPATDSLSPAVELVSFCAEADSVRWPWVPSPRLERPVAVGEIVVTSACKSVVAAGILGLGYIRADTEPGMKLHDSTGMFRNIRRTLMPFYDPAKRRPRAPWRQIPAFRRQS